jgi:hypothetical protein
MTIFNAGTRSGRSRLDATWNDVFRVSTTPRSGRHRQLTESRGTLAAIWTCWAASSGGLVKLVADMCPSSMRPHVFEAWTRCPSVSPRSATPEQCPRCSRAPSARRNCSYTELQTSADDERDHHLVLSHVLHTVDPGRVNSASIADEGFQRCGECDRRCPRLSQRLSQWLSYRDVPIVVVVFSAIALIGACAAVGVCLAFIAYTLEARSNTALNLSPSGG